MIYIKAYAMLSVWTYCFGSLRILFLIPLIPSGHDHRPDMYIMYYGIDCKINTLITMLGDFAPLHWNHVGSSQVLELCGNQFTYH